MTLRAPAWTRVKAARQEIEAWYVSRSILPPAISLDDDGTCIRLAEWRFNTPELREVDRIARKHGLELAVSGSSTRPHILVYDDPRPVFPGEPEIYDPMPTSVRSTRSSAASHLSLKASPTTTRSTSPRGRCGWRSRGIWGTAGLRGITPMSLPDPNKLHPLYLIVPSALTYAGAVFGMIAAFFTQNFGTLIISMLLLSLSMAGVYLVFRRYQWGLAEKVVNYNDCEHGILLGASECPDGPWYPACPSSDQATCRKKCITKDVWGDDR
jgi:hypothetical protein